MIDGNEYASVVKHPNQVPRSKSGNLFCFRNKDHGLTVAPEDMLYGALHPTRVEQTMKALFCAACMALFASSAIAQSNELAISTGAYIPHHVNVRSDNLFALQGSVARRVVHFPKAELSVELPIVATFDGPRVGGGPILPGQSFSTRHYSALFIAPGVRLKLLPESRLSPYFAAGGGLAHFSKSQSGGESSTNTGVFDFGGGVDFKISRLVALRGEVRDFYSGPPQLITGLLDREHQVVATGGIVFRF